MPAQSKTPKVDAKEQTYVQSVRTTRGFDSERAVLSKLLPVPYSTYRTIRKQPTVAFARAMCAAPATCGEWSLEADDDVPDDRVRFIRQQIMPIREPAMDTAMLFGNVDYGWAPFEKVFAAQNWEGSKRIVLQRLKPLLVDITDILIDPETGRFEGFRQPVPGTVRARDQWVDLPLENSFLVNFRAEGDDHYGNGLLDNVVRAQSNWEDANEGAERYDKKVAGAQWVVHYPDGQSRVDGEMKPNDEVAWAIVESLEASGSIVVPRKLVRMVEDLNQQTMADSWEIELKDHSPKQGSFIERLRYADVLSVRGLLMPERAVLEGEYGTKAEAGIHANLALAIREIEHRHVTRLVQWHIVDQLLALNFGEDARGTVRLEASPLVDEKLAFFRELYRLVLGHPTASIDALGELDIDALMDTIGVPKQRDVAFPDDESGLQQALANKLVELFDAAKRMDGVPANAQGGSRI